MLDHSAGRSPLSLQWESANGVKPGTGSYRTRPGVGARSERWVALIPGDQGLGSPGEQVDL